jgi:hypothetical protein
VTEISFEDIERISFGQDNTVTENKNANSNDSTTSTPKSACKPAPLNTNLYSTNAYMLLYRSRVGEEVKSNSNSSSTESTASSKSAAVVKKVVIPDVIAERICMENVVFQKVCFLSKID